MTYNILWGLLHGDANSGEPWVRGSGCTPGYHGRSEKAKTVFYDKDPSIRGWLVETLVQAALLSSYKNSILELDSLNTYFDALEGPYTRLYSGTPIVFVEKPEVAPSDVYKRSVSYMINGSGTTYTIYYTQSDGTTGTKVAYSYNDTIELPFFDGKIKLRGLQYVADESQSPVPERAFPVTLLQLPTYLPEEELNRRLGGNDLVEDAGRFAFSILNNLK